MRVIIDIGIYAIGVISGIALMCILTIAKRDTNE